MVVATKFRNFFLRNIDVSFFHLLLFRLAKRGAWFNAEAMGIAPDIQKCLAADMYGKIYA